MTLRALPANPWGELPCAPPYVLPCDREHVERHNAKCKPEHRYDLNLLPEPFFGRPEAPVVVLMSNPGVGGEDGRVHATPSFATLARKSLVHQLPPGGSFLHLRSDAPGGGHRYWRARTRVLAAALGEEQGEERLQEGLLALQLAPYHSKRFPTVCDRLPSQEYTLGLLNAAMHRKALILVMRGERHWNALAPLLADYDPALKIKAANPRSTYLTEGNLKEDWPLLVQALTG
jgi:hypothetical protein